MVKRHKVYTNPKNVKILIKELELTLQILADELAFLGFLGLERNKLSGINLVLDFLGAIFLSNAFSSSGLL